MNLSMQAQSRLIALEALAGEASLQQAMTRLPGFFKNVSTVLTEAFRHPIDALFPARDLKWAAGILQAQPYTTLRKQDFPCVPGMKTDYLTYTKVLAGNAVYCRALQDQMLQPLIAYLAKKLANPEALRSQAPDDSLEALSLKPLETEHAAYLAVVNLKDETTEKPYGQLIKRHADWPAVLDHAQTVHNAFTQSDHDRVTSSVDRIKHLLGTLISRTSDHHELYQVSAPVLVRIADAAYVAASAVEFYGLTYRRALILEHALDTVVTKVKQQVVAA